MVDRLRLRGGAPKLERVLGWPLDHHLPPAGRVGRQLGTAAVEKERIAGSMAMSDGCEEVKIGGGRWRCGGRRAILIHFGSSSSVVSGRLTGGQEPFGTGSRLARQMQYTNSKST